MCVYIYLFNYIQIYVQNCIWVPFCPDSMNQPAIWKNTTCVSSWNHLNSKVLKASCWRSQTWSRHNGPCGVEICWYVGCTMTGWTSIPILLLRLWPHSFLPCYLTNLTIDKELKHGMRVMKHHLLNLFFPYVFWCSLFQDLMGKSWSSLHVFWNQTSVNWYVPVHF